MALKNYKVYRTVDRFNIIFYFLGNFGLGYSLVSPPPECVTEMELPRTYLYIELPGS